MESKVDIQKVLQYQYTPYDVALTNNEVILYALSIGFSQDPLNKDHLNFTYENEENFQSFITMASIIAHKNSGELMGVEGMPAFNPMMLLYGEENIEIIKPMTVDTKLRVEERITGISDKGKLATITEEALIKNSSNGEVLAKIVRKLILRGAGGFGGKGGAKDIKYPDIPKRAPDAIIEDRTQPNQAILYRLNGDINPLHINKDMAAMGGFDQPILHGLCSFGFTARLIYQKYSSGNPQGLVKFSSRFVSHVFPGETLVVESWKDGNIIIFQTKTKERGLVCLRGFAELKESPKL
ncbi:like domain containing protein [Stylonychia lemnae]|uniref:Like domain containing protein n=1 Tax=Stylonychia lemnae TaxID=5949 RepID=A0A078B1B4_STYLE|nr:like domain containing protein [Stylonychia lemnae]|eukprot:CDW86948.1 like domain containing protein [Stylonychia lemnae]